MNARRLILPVLAVALSVLALTSAVALAAAPETPEVLAPSPLTASTATLHGVLNPGQAGAPGTFELDAYEFVYRPSTAASPGCRGEGEVVDPGLSVGEGKEKVSQAIEALTPGTEYTVCLAVHNETGEEEASSAPVTFTTPAVAPRVEEAFVSDVASTSATFNAEVYPGGTETTYAFEYAPAGGAFAPVAEAEGSGSVPAGVVGVPVSVHVAGLQSGASYEVRVVVGNSVEKQVTGEVVSLTTERSGEFVLPDGRQWEMVTPPQEEGSLFKPAMGPEEEREKFAYKIDETPDNVLAVQASAAGNGIVDEADQPVEADPQGDAIGVSVLSTRGPSGWSSQGLSGSHDEATNPSIFAGSEYRLFSEDLSRGVLQQFGNFTSLSPEAVESTPYLRADYLNGNVDERCEHSDLSENSCFEPLVTRGNTQLGVVFGDTVAGECSFFDCGPHFVAGTPDLSHVILASRERLTSTPIATEFQGSGSFVDPPLYEWTSGQLRLLNILPGKDEGDPELQLADGDKRHVMSDNGERVILEGGGALYLRNVTKSETIQLDAAESVCGACSGGGGSYMTANSEGSRIFFLDNNKLTSDSNGGSADLYECEVVEVDGKLRCNLSDLTPETGGEAANVRMVLGASEDGSDVYFVAGGALAAGGTKQGCQATYAHFEPCNLYIRHDGVTTFITELAREDTPFYGVRIYNGDKVEYGFLRARVSPNGRWLAFMSHRDLTGYDTREAGTGEPDEEVYLYDAGSNTLACASCDPTGARPVGVVGEAGIRIASIVPSLNEFEHVGVSGSDWIYQPRYLSDSGRLFFDSKDGLVPRDVNGVVDVYEYEPEGVPAGEHACSSAAQSGSEVFKPAHGFEVEGGRGVEGAGCVALISSGTSSEESTFLDASETGGDVFFLTTSKLASQDVDEAPDIYDAHECTAASPCLSVQTVQPPPCDTEGSCRGAPVPQPAVYGAPSSATFTGSGDLISAPPSLVAPKRVVRKVAKCGRGFVKGGDRCVRRRAKSGKAKRAGRAREDRRSG